jgi:hypothetical protein
MVPVPEDKRTLNFVKGNRHLRHTTLVGGIPDYDDVSGWLLLVGDADGHVGLIWSLATNRELLGSVGRHYIGWRHVAEQRSRLCETRSASITWVSPHGSLVDDTCSQNETETLKLVKN